MSTKLKVSDMLARAFAAEGVDHLFTLMGDANMYWSTAMAELPGMKVVHARHEHCAVAMADGYARATGKVGVASTTCGPGFTQIMTALTTSAKGRQPVVVFTGDTATTAAWHIHDVDQKMLTQACGAQFVAVRSIDHMMDRVREAFYIARAERTARSMSAASPNATSVTTRPSMGLTTSARSAPSPLTPSMNRPVG